MSVSDINEPCGNATNLSPSTQFPADADAVATGPTTAVLASQPQNKEVCWHDISFIHCFPRV